MEACLLLGVPLNGQNARISTEMRKATVIRYLLVMVAVETGSGKTAAFGLQLLQIVHEDLRRAETEGGRGRSGGEGSTAASDPGMYYTVPVQLTCSVGKCCALCGGLLCYAAVLHRTVGVSLPL